MGKKYEENVKIKPFENGFQIFWGSFKDTDLKACNEVCRKMGSRFKGGRSWWNEEVSESVEHWNVIKKQRYF